MFGKEADKLEHSTDDQRQYYIIEKDPLVNKFISIPKDKGNLNCATFSAGILEGILETTGFVSLYSKSKFSVLFLSQFRIWKYLELFVMCALVCADNKKCQKFLQRFHASSVFHALFTLLLKSRNNNWNFLRTGFISDNKCVFKLNCFILFQLAKVNAHWHKGTTYYIIEFDESVVARDKQLEI